jgi:epoxyqueuosine reductase
MTRLLEDTIARISSSSGADLVGFTTTKTLLNGPPSADPTYVLPSAKSVISFAVALDQEATRSFITKQKWRPHCVDRKSVCQKLYKIGDTIAGHLRSEGFEAVTIDLNNNYRTEQGVDDVTEMTEFHPVFSHRYAALAAGVGRLGWSGNLLTKEFGALVELGSVITTAELTPTSPIPDDEHPCDGCKVCSMVCPVEMIHPKNKMTVTVGGVTETISRKQPNTCCWIGCTGYEGLSTSGTWSNWSPYRLGHSLPEKKPEIDELCIGLQKKDPQMEGGSNAFDDHRRFVHDPDWFYYTVCGFCRSVCWPKRNDRLVNKKRIINSGKTALSLDGEHRAAPKDTSVLETPFGVHVVIPTSELRDKPSKPHDWPGQFPLDREVIRYVESKHSS